MIDASVVICTYNRSTHLKNVLKSLSEQIVPENLEWEIIVVDNNSIDDTSKVVKDFGNSSGTPIKYLKEEKQGLSHARNRGIMESKGKYIAFTDDDVIVDENWVSSLYEAFQRYGCDCVGGRIFMKPVRKLPRWLKKELWGFLAYLDYGNEPFQISDHFIFGTNMAFARDILDNVTYFNTELGRTGYIPIGGEETDIVKRILQKGGKAYYQPTAIVYHVIDEYKLKKSYFRRLHYYSGWCEGRFYKVKFKKHIYGIPLFIFVQLLRSVMKYLKNPTMRMQMNIWWYFGFIRGRMISHQGKAAPNGAHK